MQHFDQERENLQQIAKQNILKIQTENQRGYNKCCKKAPTYTEGDLVAIRRIQFALGLKIKKKYLGPYRVTQIKGNDRYEVIKIGNNEGPVITTTAVDYMRPYKKYPSESEG